MHDQRSADANFGPRPSATTVGQYYENAFQRAFGHLITGWLKSSKKMLELDWDDDALRAMLRELTGARADREKHYQDHIGAMPEDGRKWMELLYRKADAIAALNTVLHYKWVRDERLVSVGAGILERVGLDDEQPGADDD